MNTITLQTKRHWNWKVFFILTALNILACLAYPLCHGDLQSGNNPVAWGNVLVLAIESIVAIVIGLLAANRIGLGLPFLENWARRERASMEFRTAVALSWVIGIILGGSMLFLFIVIFGPPMETMFQEVGIDFPKPNENLPINGLFAAFYAGVTEETLSRLAGLTLIAWMGGLLFHDHSGRPKLVVFWVANILLAFIFGYGHLQTAVGSGWPINTTTITYILTLNGIGGLVFGWLYWKYGLESAVLAHFFADVMVQSVYPLVVSLKGQPDKMAVIAGLSMAILLTLTWALRVLDNANRAGRRREALKTA